MHESNVTMKTTHPTCDPTRRPGGTAAHRGLFVQAGLAGQASQCVLRGLFGWGPLDRTQGWHRYVGDEGCVLSLERFGASAPGKIVAKEFGFSVDNVYERAKALLAR